jgi:hypothetical protein
VAAGDLDVDRHVPQREDGRIGPAGAGGDDEARLAAGRRGQDGREDGGEEREEMPA